MILKGVFFIKILHLIPSLTSGGAEAMLTKLITNNKDPNATMVVVTLLNANYFYDAIANTGTKVYRLNIDQGRLSSLRIFELFKIIKREKPDVIQTWMYHCDLFGILLKMVFPKVKLVWNIRHSHLVKGADKGTTILVARILSLLSFMPDKIICGSTAAQQYHTELGYRKNKTLVIPNGFDTDIFAPNNQVKNDIKRELKIPEDHLVIGHVGRAKKIKNQIDLIKAFAEISKVHKNVTLVLLGKGMVEEYKTHELIVNNPNIRLLEETPNVARYLKAFDLFVLPSLSEGFPNVIGEAMASGVACISTEVGDSPQIIGNYEFIAKRNSLDDLREKINYWLELEEEKKEELKVSSRKRILELYSIEKIVQLYVSLYRKVA
ncbi:glycosyltransferase [Planomicrobium sp. CPCC 101110]|uniref:glycosyltransferase n=1 Tax=Planomicrobium sp. CPCC 101110 TaxID=2599619 RepID=UPI0011B5879B|nr:glycosyltransferase [Planomicrobium sp. CPCC 101110]TWT27774.1 glycosyltransferase [Planomicrobium sp. CPCC 101110]